MFRVATAIAFAVLLGPDALAAQAKWLVLVNGGYAHGVGDNFEGPGSLSGTAFVYRPVARGVDLGLELGYHNTGTNGTRIADLYGPGSTYREDFTRSVWQATIGARVRPASRVRPYAGVGGGGYLLRIRDVIVVRDAAGEPIPGRQFRDTAAELHPGVNAGVGIDRLVSLGRLGLGVHARWHGVIVGGGFADFVSVSVGLALD